MRRIYPWLAVILLAGAFTLRVAQWDLRPFHTDEAVQAFQTWKLIKGEGYRYDPADKHGPSLYYATAATAKVLGWQPSELKETHFRAIAMAGGLALLSMLLVWHERLGGRRTVLFAVVLLGVAPLSVLYNTYFVQEAWFVFFSWMLLSALCQYAENPSVENALWIGLWAGGMQITKETSVLHFAAAAIAITIVFRGPISEAWQKRRTHLRGGLWAFIAAGMVYGLFYSSFFTNMAGLWDGISTYFHYAKRAEGAGHAAPWHAYLGIFWPHLREGVRWSELSLLITAGLGALEMARRKTICPPFLKVGVLFSLVLFGIYSAIPYKTPWLLLTPYVGVCLLASFGLTSVWRRRNNHLARVLTAVLATTTVVELFWREQRALHRFAGDARVPYFYQQTSPQFPEIITNLERLREATPGKAPSVLVCSPDHAWPIPWYLRNWNRVGYHTQEPMTGAYDVILVDSRLPSDTQRRLLGNLPAEPYGLRPNVLLWLATKITPAPLTEPNKQ